MHKLALMKVSLVAVPLLVLGGVAYGQQSMQGGNQENASPNPNPETPGASSSQDQSTSASKPTRLTRNQKNRSHHTMSSGSSASGSSDSSGAASPGNSSSPGMGSSPSGSMAPEAGKPAPQ